MSETMACRSWDLPDTFDFQGQKIRYGAMGKGEPLVLLHGTPFSSVVWRRIAPQFARNHRVYYFDLLGYGRSDKQHGQDVSLGVQNQVFTALLDHWDLGFLMLSATISGEPQRYGRTCSTGATIGP